MNECKRPTRSKIRQEAAADADLHQPIYEATHHVVLPHVMRVFGDLLRNGVLHNRHQLYRRFGVRDQLLKQHLAVAKDRKAAEKTTADHIHYAFRTIEDIGRDAERVEASLRRVPRSGLPAESRVARPRGRPQCGDLPGATH